MLSPPVYAANKGRPKFDAWVSQQLQRYHIYGASIAIIKNYQVAYQKGYGYADFSTKKRVLPNTLFQIGSVTKPITALAAILAVEQGKLKFDVDVNRYLVHWKVPKSLYTSHKLVTLQRLLTHTAGIVAQGYPGYCVHCKRPTLLQVLKGAPPANNKPIEVVSVPGEKYSYSTPGYVIVQQLLEDVYHQPFVDIIKTLVTTPLGMDSSTFETPLPKVLSARAETPYDKNQRPVVGGPHAMIGSAAGGMWSTATDLAKFIVAIQKGLANHSSPLSYKVANLMVKPIVGVDDRMSASLAFEILLNKKYNQKRHTYFMHAGQFFGSEAFVIGDEQRGNGAIVLINSCFDRSVKPVKPPYKPDQCGPALQADAISFRSLVIRRIAKLEKW